MCTFDEHPVEAGEVEEEGGDPAGAVDLVKQWEQVPSKFWERNLSFMNCLMFSNQVKTL